MAVSKLLCILWFAALVGASGHGHVHSNNVCFNGISSVGFMLTNQFISEGQPWRNPVIEKDTVHNKLCLNIGAGRHSSEYVAMEFKTGLQFDNILKDSPLGGTDVPQTLHFFVEGTLVIDSVECPGIRLAQGHQFPSDPWWIGSRSCSHWTPGVGNSHSSMVCECRNGAQLKLSHDYYRDYEFNALLIRPPDASMAMQQGTVSEFGNGSAALAAAAAPRLALKGNSTMLRGSLNNQPSSLSAATQRSSISEAGSATATAALAGETTSKNDKIEAIFYP